MDHGETPYSETQDQLDRGYKQAWDSAPESWKAKVAAIGLKAEVDSPGDIGVMLYDETLSRVNCPGHSPSFYTPDIAETIDTLVDHTIEKYGCDSEPMIRAIFNDLQAPMREEIKKNQALMLGRVAMYLVQSETNNILARAHQLMHAIPRLASITGYASMRESARACGVSPEWIRRGRDKWCAHLGLPIPEESQKTEAAKTKYKTNAKSNHWRHQAFQPKNKTQCQPTPTPLPQAA